MNTNKESCLKTSNNKFFGCPPRMDDGRHFTDYRPTCHVNNLIRNNNNTYNSYQYRMFLTQNANNMMSTNRKNACQKNCCGPCKKPYNIGTMFPEKDKMECLGEDCKFKPLETNGLGNGRIYSSQPLKCPNWPDDPSILPKNCCSDPQNSFNYYQGPSVEKTRLTIPGGGIPGKGGDSNHYY